jgi:ElaB/YqjD/DUF883 family membrane-anchored ribosome-binding protein
MTQRVTLTYSVELEQLEQETQRLYDNAATLLVSACDQSSNECEMLSTTTLSQIEQLRHNLASVDVMLSDIGQIIQSYIQYRFRQDVPAATVPDLSIVENALSQLNDLKETMANEPHPSQEDLTP